MAEINSGPDAHLTRLWKNKTLELPVSRAATEDRDVSLRRAIHLNFPNLHTLQDLVPICTKSIPFPQRRLRRRRRSTPALQYQVYQARARKKSYGPRHPSDCRLIPQPTPEYS